MGAHRCLRITGCAVLVVRLASAQEPDDPPIEVTVRGPQPDAGEVDVTGSLPRAGTAEALAETPGIGLVRRGAAGGEPVIRGQGFERVATQLGPLPLYGACPGRMDPPVAYLRPTLAPHLQVVMGLASVTLGPGGTAGRIVAETGEQPLPDGAHGWLQAGFDGSRRGGLGQGAIEVGRSGADGRLAVEGIRMTDYRAGDGRRVPADQTEYGGAATIGIEPATGQRTWHSFGYQRHESVDYPALPMDLEATDAWFYDGGYRIRVDDPLLRGSQVQIAAASIDHAMSNALKSNRSMLEAEAETAVRGVGTRARLDWQFGSVAVQTGADSSLLRRDGTRHRFLPGSGLEFEDRLWPDATQRDLGGFVEATWRYRDHLTLRVGGRVDQVASAVRGADAPSLGGQTVLAQFVRFNGPGGSDLQDTELAGAGNALLTWQLQRGVSTQLGFGTSVRPAGITERYYAFAPAPGGFQVGNPGLLPERKLEVEWGGAVQQRWLELRTSVYAHRYRDYIESTALLHEDINGDAIPDWVRGFRNVEARLLGGEVNAVARLSHRWTLPLGFAAVYGQDLTNRQPLAEIPPWELQSGVRFANGGRLPWWSQVGARTVGRQDRIDPDFGEDATPGFTTVHLRGGVLVKPHLRFEAGIENLLDASYHEHLTREVALPVGDLRAGDELPAPGRSAYVVVRADL